MLSSESLLLALNSGCLNSQAWAESEAKANSASNGPTYPGSVRRLATLLVVVPDFVEVIFIQLSHKAGKIAMFEVFRKNGLGEALVLTGVSQALRVLGAADD